MEVQEWKSEGRRLVSDCRVFKVTARKFRHPDGRTGEFFVNESSDWVQCAALARDEQNRLCIVTVKQFRFGVERMSLELPGGVIDGNETPVHAAQRELLEETGYAGENARIVASFSPNPAIQNNRAHFVIVQNCKKIGGTNFDPNEEIQTFLTPVSELDELIANGEIYHSIAIDAVYFLQKELSKMGIS